jgi:cullin 3
VSDDAERGMLAKLKTECGYQFTQKMEGMFNDMKLSAEATEDYMKKSTVRVASFWKIFSGSDGSQTPEVGLSVIIMTTGAWPMNHSPSPCILPAHLMRACKSFEQFYLSRHSGRRISWQYSLGHADLIARFKNRTHELNVTTFAMVILYLFEDLPDEEFLTYSVSHVYNTLSLD